MHVEKPVLHNVHFKMPVDDFKMFKAATVLEGSSCKVVLIKLMLEYVEKNKNLISNIAKDI